MLQLKNIRVVSFDIDYLDIFWDVEPTYDDVLNYSFVIEKSDAEFGPYQDLTQEFADKYHVRDNTVRGQHAFYHKIYYRIRVKNLTSGETATFPESGAGVKLSAKPDLIALEMARMTRLRLKEFSGRKIWIFPRKKSGQRCNCYDEVTGRKMRSSCPTCFDVGFVGGFDTPVETYAQIMTNQETTQRRNIGEIEVENCTGSFSNYPELSEGWIIVEAENIRWRVASSLTKIRKGRSLVRQFVSLHRIPESDVEYSIPLNLTNIQDIIASPERNYTNPHTLASTEAVTSAIEFYKG